LEALEFGEGGLVTGPVPCALPEWRLEAQDLDPGKAKYLAGFDREEARRLLAEAGHPKGFSTPLYHHPGYTTPWPSRYELAVDELSKVGITVELKPQEYGDYIATTYLGKFDKLAMGPIASFLREPQDPYLPGRRVWRVAGGADHACYALVDARSTAPGLQSHRLGEGLAGA
jgi:ABC-type transport system substrate-binding protein